ncbi:MAG: UvrD-helicase domain-containing protein [Bacteroidales bacterium]|nr:UvrD-helicase domain-containing protein [Bacteroidales bacterium]
MIRILKASAGAGKTYALANNYLALLTERFAYRHILAVTFTNKATAEMKSRILQFLYESEDPSRKDTLRDILHDYSAFAVTTIDKFFQQALKAFAREIGQVADYQIDLDKDALTVEAMDRILDSLTAERTDVLEWLRRSVADSLDQGKRVSIENELYELGGRLMMGEAGDRDELKKRFSRENLEALMRNCNGIIQNFTDKVNAAVPGVSVSKVHSIKNLATYQKGCEPWQKIPAPGATLAKEAEGSEFCKLFEGDEFRWYNTAWLLRDLGFSLGLAGEFYRSFEDLLKEKNVMVLDESNEILKDIIAGSDAPFVYEKMGVRYENFLLDEFQDTSNIQWENFRPLLRESDAGGHRNLIVGDVKQSIYRWRDSDWTLLAKKVEEDFPRAETEPLDSNWRSCRTIVEFNNAFFKFAAQAIGKEDLYKDVKQEVRVKDEPQEGMVRISFRQKEDEIPLVLESIAEARKAGAKHGDIAILVRARKEGSAVAAALMEAGIPVVSDDSLTLKSSVIVRKLTGILANHDNPDDKINAFIAERESVVFPDEYHSLTDLCENLLRQLEASSPDVFAGETLYIQAFMDDLREWSDANGNELRYYLRHWQESNTTISSPDNKDAVRVITIHKSKGLEFKYLIFPFADSVEFYKAGWHWCRLDTAGTPFIPEAEGTYPVMLGNAADNTLFDRAKMEEEEMQKVDNINVFYVALTRAEKCLHVIAAQPSKTFRTAKTPEYRDFSQLLYDFCGRMDDFSYGKPYVFSQKEDSPAAKQQGLPFRYTSIPIGDRLKVSADASDFFGEDGAVGAAASPRRNGIALHSILSRVQQASDLRAAVDEAVLEGQLTPEDGEDAFALLSERIAAHPEWFSSRGLNEITIFNAYGDDRRPDRVVFLQDQVVIVDYKFGDSTPKSDAKYSNQVSAYMSIFRSMGYKNVSGAVWYVVPDKLITL